METQTPVCFIREGTVMDNQEYSDDFQPEEKAKEVVNSEPVEKKGQTDALKFLLGMLVGAVIMFLLCLFIVVLPARKQRVQAQNQPGSEIKTPAEAGQELLDEATVAKIGKLKTILDNYYYEDVSIDTLREAIFHSIISSTKDRYSTYYSEEELRSANEDWEGKFYGIGAVLTIDPESTYTMIDSVNVGSPAEKAGIKAGDYIMEVDGVDVGGWTLTEVVKVVRGEDGTDVVLTIVRAGVAMEITVTRGEVTIDDVVYEKKEDGIGYIRIASFSDIAVSEFADSIAQAKADDVKGIIVDLRGNPGGGLDVVYEICNEFMPQGLVVYTEDKYGNRDDYYCDGLNEWDIPMVVLIDGSSASASEIFAAAVKDHGVATLVGTKTYGKGVYQSVIQLTDGSAVKVTSGKFYSPNGVCFHGVGVEPDVEVPFDSEKYLEDETDNQLEKAIEVLKEKMNR